VEKFLDGYSEPGPLLVPEIGNAAEFGSGFVCRRWPGAVMFGPFASTHRYPITHLGKVSTSDARLRRAHLLLALRLANWARISRQPDLGRGQGVDGAATRNHLRALESDAHSLAGACWGGLLT
jgi:hypothetical protein